MESIKKILFEKDSYQTKPNSRKLIDKLALNTRVYFVIKYLQILFANRKIAKKGQYNRTNWALSSYKIVKLIEDCGGQFEIEGIDHLKSIKEPVVIVSNHMSAMESMIFPALLAPFFEVTFVVKESLAKHFLFGVIMRARNPITVGRTNSKEDLIKVINKGKEFTKVIGEIKKDKITKKMAVELQQEKKKVYIAAYCIKYYFNRKRIVYCICIR